LIRSYRIEFYFSVAVARRPGAPPTRMRGKLARQPTGPAGLFAYMATAFTERQYGHGFTETVRDTNERKRKAGNQALLWITNVVLARVQSAVSSLCPVYFRDSAARRRSYFVWRGWPVRQFLRQQRRGTRRRRTISRQTFQPLPLRRRPPPTPDRRLRRTHAAGRTSRLETVELDCSLRTSSAASWSAQHQPRLGDMVMIIINCAEIRVTLSH